MRIDRKLLENLDYAIHKALDSPTVEKAVQAICEEADCNVSIELSMAFFERSKKQRKPLFSRMKRDVEFMKFMTSIGADEGPGEK